MQFRLLALLGLALALGVASSDDDDIESVDGHHHHHGHHHHKHPKKDDKVTKDDKVVVATQPQVVPKAAVQAASSIVAKMKAIEAKLAAKAKGQVQPISEGHILVNGPLPADFNERFIQAVAHAADTDTSKIKVVSVTPAEGNPGVSEVSFSAPSSVVSSVEKQASDPDSKLAGGNMHRFLVADSDDDSSSAPTFAYAIPKEKGAMNLKEDEGAKMTAHEAHEEPTPVEEKGIDIDTQMPYGDLEPFGREDTAQELTESSVKESDSMVDQLERAEVAEEKRAVFRALTRLRGAAITSFDGVARSQTGNIDEYNKVHKWRNSHPLHHLADEESDVQKWAFPDNADF